MKCPHCQHEIFRQTSIVIEHNGEKISLRELSRRTGMAYTTLQNRYGRGLRGEKLLGAIDMRRTRNKPKAPRSDISKLINQFISGVAPRETSQIP